VVNDPLEAERMAKAAKEVVGEAGVQEITPVMAGEDFAYYLMERPGAFCFVGAGNAEQGISQPHHHPRFDIDERAMKVAAELSVRTALCYLDSVSGVK
jgi:amidohydrolase